MSLLLCCLCDCYPIICCNNSGSDAPNYAAFSYLGLMIEQMFKTKSAPYPVERTLLVTGALDALMTSHAEGEGRIETPHLASIAVRIVISFHLKPT